MSRPAQTRTQQGEEDEGLRGPSQRARVTPPPRVAGILTFRLKCHTICSQQREGPISIRAWPNSLSWVRWIINPILEWADQF
jgi:hypothetical protein